MESKSKVELALEMVRGKLANGGTWFGHDVVQVEAALVEAIAAERKASEKKPAKAGK